MKHVTAVLYLVTLFFPQFLENSRSYSNVYHNLISPKKHVPVKWQRIDDSMEYISRITDGHHNYEKCECSDWCIKKEPQSEI